MLRSSLTWECVVNSGRFHPSVLCPIRNKTFSDCAAISLQWASQSFG